MPHTVREDKFGRYIRNNGIIFRPLFPIDYPPHSNTTHYATGTRVQCDHRVGTPLAIVTKFGDRRNETWFAHGSYMRPDGSYRDSEECYKPFGFSWAGGIADKQSATVH